MAKIKLMQLLCPLRHCIMGVAFDPDKTNEDDAQETIKTGMKKLNVNHWCALCFSCDLRFEVSTTKQTGRLRPPALGSEVV